MLTDTVVCYIGKTSEMPNFCACILKLEKPTDKVCVGRALSERRAPSVVAAELGRHANH